MESSEEPPRYGRGTKLFFGFMALVMVIGYPLSLLSGFPAFQDLFGGTGGNPAKTELEKARKDVRRYDCGEKKVKRVGKCKDALTRLGSSYQTLAQPEDTGDPNNPGEPPKNADEYLKKAVDAFERKYAIDPKDDESAQQLAVAYQETGAAAKAEPLYARLVKADPEDEDLLFQWALAAQQSQKNQVALLAFQRFIELVPEDQRAEYAREQVKQLKTGGGGGQPITLPQG